MSLFTLPSHYISPLPSLTPLQQLIIVYLEIILLVQINNDLDDADDDLDYDIVDHVESKRDEEDDDDATTMDETSLGTMKSIWDDPAQEDVRTFVSTMRIGTWVVHTRFVAVSPPQIFFHVVLNKNFIYMYYNYAL
jgi:hypothetical protein